MTAIEIQSPETYIIASTDTAITKNSNLNIVDNTDNAQLVLIGVASLNTNFALGSDIQGLESIQGLVQTNIGYLLSIQNPLSITALAVEKVEENIAYIAIVNIRLSQTLTYSVNFQEFPINVKHVHGIH